MTKQIELIDFEILKLVADRLKVIAHPMRLRIIDILLKDNLSVKEIAIMCNIRQSKASDHLRLMKIHKLVTSERRGKSVYYETSCSSLSIILDCMTKARERELGISSESSE